LIGYAQVSSGSLSYYDQIDDVGRDQGLTFQACNPCGTLIEVYPDSELCQLGVLKIRSGL